MPSVGQRLSDRRPTRRVAIDEEFQYLFGANSAPYPPSRDVLQADMRSYWKATQARPLNVVIVSLRPREKQPPKGHAYALSRPRRDLWTAVEDAILAHEYPRGGTGRVKRTQKALMTAGFRLRTERAIMMHARNLGIRGKGK